MHTKIPDCQLVSHKLSVVVHRYPSEVLGMAHAARIYSEAGPQLPTLPMRVDGIRIVAQVSIVGRNIAASWPDAQALQDKVLLFRYWRRQWAYSTKLLLVPLRVPRWNGDHYQREARIDLFAGLANMYGWFANEPIVVDDPTRT